MNRSSPDARTLSTRASKVILAAVLVTAVSGYFMGLHQTKAARAGSAAAEAGSPAVVSVPDATGVPEIVEYARLGSTPWKPNAAWRSRLDQLRSTSASASAATGGPSGTSVASLAVAGDGPAAVVVASGVSDAERGRAVEERAGRRAFEGAPPVIPHPVDPLAPDNCRACHLGGMAVRGVVARRMSHGELGSCVQCHVPARGPGPGEAPDGGARFDANAFVGLGSAGRGARAWPGAPPTIPHTLWMRQECASCHGPGGLEGLRTGHPERVLCRQCHVPDGAVDTPPWLRSDLVWMPAAVPAGVGAGVGAGGWR